MKIKVVFAVIAIGIIISVGFGSNEVYNVKEETNNEVRFAPELSNSESLSLSTSQGLIPDKIAAQVLTCTIKSGRYNLDIKLTNLGSVYKHVIIYPHRMEVELLPNQIKRIGYSLSNENSTIKFVTEESEEVELSVPTCINGGGDSGTKSGVIQAVQMQKTNQNTNKTEPENEPEINISIPEFQWAGFPMITIFLFAYFLILKGKYN